jgi:hypothetical protein
MKTYETTLEEVAEGHLVPSVIVSIADYETGKHKEEIYGYMSMIKSGYKSGSLPVC